jgi:SAM-dependent methyltransferase
MQQVLEEHRYPMFHESANYYDAIYAAQGKDYEAEARRVTQLIRAHGPAACRSLLDVGCGTGGHLRYFRLEFDAEGLDLDGAMLDVARRALPDVPLHRADMVDFRLPRTYDAIVCLFSAIGYCASLARLGQALRTMAAHLRPGGVVIIEPWFTPDGFQPVGVHATFVNLPELKIARMNRNAVRNGISLLHFHYLVATPDKVLRFEETHRLGLFTHSQYVAAMEAANLDVLHDPQGITGRGLYIGRKRGLSPEARPPA